MQDYVQLRQVKETKHLVRFMTIVPPADLVDTLRQVSAFEITQQIQIGNRPSAILSDGRNQPITAARRRVVGLFGNAAQIAAALHEAFALLRKLTRQKTGRARGSFVLMLNNKVVGDETMVDQIAMKMTQRDFAIMLGPTVRYGRKLYWNPARGGDKPLTKIRRKKKGTFRHIGGGKVHVYTRFREGMGMTVERMLAKKYRALAVTEYWPATPYFSGIPKKDANTPGILIRYKAGKRARVN